MSEPLSLHIACDHAGTQLKETLKAFLTAQYAEKGTPLSLTDHGTYSNESCDYPLFAHAACADIEKENSLGLLICGTGIGMSMVANRHKGIRAALCTTELHARLSRRHNN
ncbi:MAG: RpiB/LacA/LacB family sugar-phosphate isomerase, partial [Desulfovibrio sp.]|nr:RpiB/LacA/LacB family sugar-phosphate isomerase [Desulfovibrio sp.]